MSFLETKDKRISAALTTVIAMFILFLIFNFGMTYFDPPKEYGIAVNFGTNDFGSGNVQPKEALKPAQQEIVEEEQVKEETPVEEDVVEEEVVESTPVQNDTAEEVITQDSEDAIAIKKKEDANKKKEADRITEEKLKIEKERVAEIERKKLAEKKRAEKERKAKEAKRKNSDALFKSFSDGNGNATGGEGDDTKPGDKGKVTGDPNKSGYYENSYYGSGNRQGYGLNGRNLITKGDIYKQNCNEYGIVVVKIEVDRNGKVIGATPGVKGSTSTASCLLIPAKKVALSYKWNFDSKAPSKQIGFITVNFKPNDSN